MSDVYTFPAGDPAHVPAPGLDDEVGPGVLGEQLPEGLQVAGVQGVLGDQVLAHRGRRRGPGRQQLPAAGLLLQHVAGELTGGRPPLVSVSLQHVLVQLQRAQGRAAKDEAAVLRHVRDSFGRENVSGGKRRELESRRSAARRGAAVVPRLLPAAAVRFGPRVSVRLTCSWTCCQLLGRLSQKGCFDILHSGPGRQRDAPQFSIYSTSVRPLVWAQHPARLHGGIELLLLTE